MPSPNVSVSVNDQSIYSEPNPTTVPLFVVATRANKITPDGTGTAAGTTESNKLRVVTSQRELLVNYGNPVFVTSDGDPVHGDETNEYSLLAAHAFLGQASRAYIMRADLDIGQLIPSDVEPVLPPPDGTYWIDSDAVVGGIFIFDGGLWKSLAALGRSFTVYTTPPTGADGNEDDWGFDYSNSDGALIFKKGGAWHKASDANLVAEYGGTTNLTASVTAPTGTNAENGDVWYKTTSSAGGTDLKLSRYRAADGVFVTQTIIRDTVMPVPNENVVWEDLGFLNSDGNRPLYIGTGEEFIPLGPFVQPEAPVVNPDQGTYWFDDNITDFALYLEGTDVGAGNQWVPVETTTVSNPTATQKVISASAPGFPNEGAIWIDLSTPENVDNFPVVQRWQGGEWVDITDSVLIQSEDPIASVVLNGTYWLNLGESRTRNTVRTYDPTFQSVTVVFNGTSSQWEVINEVGWQWAPAAGATFGRKAQREIVVEKMQAAFASNDEIRAETNYYQLIACPGYPELYDEMIALNSDNGEVSFVVADTPKFMIPSGIPSGREITAAEWYSNAQNVTVTGENGFASGPSVYAGFYYPWGITSNIDGNDVVVPPSHMAMRTIAYSDQISAPWFPPAGYTRGRVDSASAVGYINNAGEFTPRQLTRPQRDVLSGNNINPIAFIPNRGLTVFGQKTNAATATALDRINVARLIAKMKYDLQRLLEPFLFELNDPVTRRSAQVVTERYLAGLKSLRALFDYAVRCDESNNPADVIDRNELYVDVAIKPAKAIEFIFVPITVLGTGDEFPF